MNVKNYVPKLAIVIPTYNNAELLDRALFSLEAQIDKDFVAVIVDDASENSVLAKVQAHKCILSELLVNAVNLGVGETRNAGLKEARKMGCEYVLFLDADDVLTPATTAIINGKIRSETGFDVLKSPVLVETESRKFAYLDPNIITWIHGKVYRIGFLKENNIEFPDINFNEDFAFNWQAYEHTKKEISVNEVFCVWTNNKNSITRKNPLNPDIAAGYIACAFWTACKLNEKKNGIQKRDILPDIISKCYYFTDLSEIIFQSKAHLCNVCFSKFLSAINFGELIENPEFAVAIMRALSSVSTPIQNIQYYPKNNFGYYMNRYGYDFERYNGTYIKPEGS